jgi:hypothetical protein
VAPGQREVETTETCLKLESLSGVRGHSKLVVCFASVLGTRACAAFLRVVCARAVACLTVLGSALLLGWW